MTKNEKKVVLFLSKDMVFKPIFLKLILQFGKNSSIVGIVECPANKKLNFKNVSPFTEWGFGGTFAIGMSVLLKKLAHFIFKRLRLDQQNSLQGIAKKHSISYLYAPKINDLEVINFIHKNGANLAISFQHQKILKPLLQSLKYPVFNIHPSNLPKYRGVKPIHWAALSGDKTFAVSLHTVEPDFDTGDIWLKKIINLNKNFTFFEYYRAAHIAAAFLVVDLINDFEELEDTKKERSDKSHRYYKAPKRKQYIELLEAGWKRF